MHRRRPSARRDRRSLAPAAHPAVPNRRCSIPHRTSGGRSPFCPRSTYLVSLRARLSAAMVAGASLLVPPWGHVAARSGQWVSSLLAEHALITRAPRWLARRAMTRPWRRLDGEYAERDRGASLKGARP